MATMALCFTGGALLAAALILTIGAAIRFRLTAEYSAVRLVLEVSLPVGPALIHADYLLLWQERAVYRNGKRLKPKRRKKLRRGRLSLPDGLRAAKQGVRVVRLTAYGGVGIRDDACLAVLLTGALKELLELASALLGAHSFHIGLCPAFGRDEFCLDMEGILRLRPAQIICAALKLPKMRGRKIIQWRAAAHDASR